MQRTRTTPTSTNAHIRPHTHTNAQIRPHTHAYHIQQFVIPPRVQHPGCACAFAAPVQTGQRKKNKVTRCAVLSRSLRTPRPSEPNHRCIAPHQLPRRADSLVIKVVRLDGDCPQCSPSYAIRLCGSSRAQTHRASVQRARIPSMYARSRKNICPNVNLVRALAGLRAPRSSAIHTSPSST